MTLYCYFLVNVSNRDQMQIRKYLHWPSRFALIFHTISSSKCDRPFFALSQQEWVKNCENVMFILDKVATLGLNITCLQIMKILLTPYIIIQWRCRFYIAELLRWGGQVYCLVLSHIVKPNKTIRYHDNEVICTCGTGWNLHLT